jgi:hypothetical protein
MLAAPVGATRWAWDGAPVAGRRADLPLSLLDDNREGEIPSQFLAIATAVW